jgi:hypothetical protein
MKTLIFIILAIIVCSCNTITTTYQQDYQRLVVDTVGFEQFAIDLLEASSDRHYTDRTRKRYDISSAVNEAEWKYKQLVEGLKVARHDGNIYKGTFFIPWYKLDSLQTHYFNMSKRNDGAKVEVKTEIIKLN